MKIAILCDTHAGIKNGSELFMDYVERFYSTVFFPYCQEHNIKTIIHLGDYFDHRKYVNYRVLSRDRSMFIDRLRENDMHMHIFPGNHDIYWNNTSELCSLTEELTRYKEISVHVKPSVVDFDGTPIALLPWINASNHAESIDFIQNARSPILMGHLELAGFPIIHGGNIISHGMNHAEFARYEMVLSGHYHTKSIKDNVHYLGTQFEMTWADVNDPKYFHVFDTETRELVAIRNPHKLYHKVYYDDSKDEVVIPAEIKSAKGCYIKVVVAHKKDPYTFDKFLDIIQAIEPYDLKIVESFNEFNSNSIDDNNLAMQDTGTLINSYIDTLETALEKNKLKTIMHSLYVEALNTSVE